MGKESREYETCACRHVTRGQIEDFIRKTQITDLKEICKKMNIGNKCGGCREMIMEISDAVMGQ